jgi:two-component system, OmpR family, sensor kinase
VGNTVRRPRTLRWRLVAIIAVLLAATSLVIGGITVIALQGYLVRQVDQNLAVASQRSLSARGEIPPQPPEGRPPQQPSNGVPQRAFIGAPGQSADTVVAVIINGKFVVEGFIDAHGQQHALSAHAQSVLKALPADGKPHTRDLGGTLGAYRLVSSTATGRTVFVTGLPLAPVQSTIDQLTLVVGLVTLAGLVIGVAAGAVVIQRALRPLQHVAATASAVTELTLDRGELPLSTRVDQRDIVSGTEVGRVGTALNQLLGHVEDALSVREAAEVKVRTFVADASHELRTPLATVRAYAELSKQDYSEAPPGLKQNIDRIESEAVRMTSLVEELLLLARLDSEAERQQSPVDLSQIVAEVVADAHAAGADHVWRIDMSEHPVMVIGDETQLRNVVVNLVANARVHTPAGTTVVVSVRRASAGEAVLEVTDDGPGIDADLIPTLFERFARGDGSRSRDAGSTGLGLAIVRAVVEAHGGTVSVESAPDRTCFRVTLP